MKLKGISEDGIRRIASVVGQQEPDYGEGGNVERLERIFRSITINAEWTSEGWVVDGDLNFTDLEITRLPKIKSINGHFSCAHNELTSLEGAPQEVSGDFYCYDNPGNFTEKDVRAVCDVGGEIIIIDDDSTNNENNNEMNNIYEDLFGVFADIKRKKVILTRDDEDITKEFINKYPGVEIYVDEHPEGSDRGGYVPTIEYEGKQYYFMELDNEWYKVRSRKGIRRLARKYSQQEPDYGDGDIEEIRESLEDAGAEWTPNGWNVPDDLDLIYCEMKRLPQMKYVDGDLNISNNKLTSLSGCPYEVGGNFDCSHNELDSMKGAPSLVYGDFICVGQPSSIPKREVTKYSDVAGEVVADIGRVPSK